MEDDREKTWVPSLKSVVYLLHLPIRHLTCERFVCTKHHSPNSRYVLSRLFYTSIRWVKTPTLREGKVLAQNPRGGQRESLHSPLSCTRSLTTPCYVQPLDIALWEGTGCAIMTSNASILPPIEEEDVVTHAA